LSPWNDVINVGSILPDNIFVLRIRGDLLSIGDSIIQNTASVLSDVNDPNLNNNTHTINTLLNAFTDLELVKSGPATITAGDTITYEIVVTNHSDIFTAEGVFVQDFVPSIINNPEYSLDTAVQLVPLVQYPHNRRSGTSAIQIAFDKRSCP
jgi:uncharacterized repeat protein (TIGR01451 family)